MTAPISIILITYNSERYLPRCAEGVHGQTEGPIQIVIVDNASTDRSALLARQLFPAAIHLVNKNNTGFAAAANQGIAASSAEFILLLNPDVYLKSDYLWNIVEALETAGPTFGSATGKLLRGIGDGIAPTDVIDSRGIRMTRSGRHLDIDAGRPDRETDHRPREVFGVSGAAALYRRRYALDAAIGEEVFDEDFFAYREDADLAWRGRLFGWRALYVPDAVAYHVRRVTPQTRRSLPAVINMHSVKNRFLLRLKNQSLWLALRHFPFQFARDIVVILATLTVERSSLPAFTWLWQHRTQIMRKRSIIERRRRVSDRDLVAWFDRRS